MTQKEAKEIVAFVNNLLQSEQIRRVNGPINWADLRVTEIAEKRYLYPDIYDTVVISIEEAAPDNSELKEFILSALNCAYNRKEFEIEIAW